MRKRFPGGMFRLSIPALLLFASWLPVVAQEHVIVGTYGARNAYRGSTVWVDISHGWYDFVEFTVSPSSDWVSAPGHKFRTGDLVKVFAETKLPHPLPRDRFIYVCDVQPDLFRFAQYPNHSCRSTTRVKFADSGIGRLRAGKRRNFNHVLIKPELDGLPGGVTARIRCGSGADCVDGKAKWPGMRYSSGGYDPFYIALDISPHAALGPAIITVQIIPTGRTYVHNVQLPLTIHELLPTPVRAASSSKPLPGLAKWEDTMLRLGRKWCNPENPVHRMAFGVETQVWAYDGAAIYYRMADYLKDPSWKACGENIASQYADYVNANNGKIPGWRMFSEGLEAAYRATGNRKYLTAMSYLANNALTSYFGGGIRDDQIRETGHQLSTMVVYERVTGKRPAALLNSVNLLLGIFDQNFTSNTFVYQQLFMDGIAMRALISYWELTKDPRIPAAVKNALDWIWNNAWIPETNRLMINTEPAGPRCDWGCQTPDTTLLNMTAPAFAWYWSITGDPTYLEYADIMFEHALDMDISFSGKVFSQAYTWSFATVDWRTAVAPTR